MNDALQERLESQLHEKMLAENEAYLADMKTRPVDEIIQSAYQIAWRENMLYLFESTTSLTPRQLEVLLELEQPLSELYDRWLGQDSQEMDLCAGVWKTMQITFWNAKRRKSTAIRRSQFIQSHCERHETAENCWNGEAIIGAARNAPRCSDRRHLFPIMRGIFLPFWAGRLRPTEKSGVCWCLPAPCSSGRRMIVSLS